MLHYFKKAFVMGLGFGAGLLVIGATVLFAQSMKTFSSGNVVSASDFNSNFTSLATGVQGLDTRVTTAENTLTKIVPVGTIMAWHKNLTAPVMTLPAGWLECNGQTVADADSPFNGLNLPDLNNQRRFLRGNPTSGPLENSQFAQHTHVSPIVTRAPMATWTNFGIGPASLGSIYGGVCGLDNSFEAINPFVSYAGSGSETRPINMSVVWIIRIK